MAGLEDSFPDHPWLWEDQLKLLDPWAWPPQMEALSPQARTEALALMEKLLAHFPNGWGWNYQRLGDIYRELGRFRQAATCYRRAARCAPRSAHPWRCLAEVLLKLDEGEKEIGRAHV